MTRNPRFFLQSFAAAAALASLAFIFCAQRLFHSGYFTVVNADHLIRYAYLLEAFRDYTADGIWYPRWIHNLYGGYGYPTFLLYQPGFWFFSLPFIWLAHSPVLAFKLSGLAIVFLRLAVIYKMIRFFGATPIISYGAVVAMVILFPDYGALVDSPATSQNYADVFALWGIYFWGCTR